MADLDKVANDVAELTKAVSGLTEIVVNKAKQVDNPFNGNGRAPGVVVGESKASRPFSVSRLAKALVPSSSHDSREFAKEELAFATRIAKAMGKTGYLVPLGVNEFKATMAASGLDQDTPEVTDICKSWRQMNTAREAQMGSLDVELYNAIAGDDYARINKDLTAGTATTGGSFIPGPARGELIDMLRQASLFDQIPGIVNMTLPAQGTIEFPTITSSATTTAFAESVAATASTPGTGLLRMEAKGYQGMIKCTERFLMYAQSLEGDALARRELAYSSQLKVDRDIIDGPGGTFIKGLITYSGKTSRTASTTGSDGNTLEMEDIDLLVASMAEANVNVNDVVVCTRPLAWTGLKYRQDSNGLPVFQAAMSAYGGGKVVELYSGKRVISCNQISNTRRKGSGTDLTYVMVLVPSEIVIGRVGVMELKMTDSDGTDFQSGTVTLRGTQFVDAIPKHQEAVGLIDSLLNY